MATAYDLIRSALRLVGVYATGEALQIDDATDSLVVLNDLIDSWNAARLTIFTTKSEDFPLIGGQQTYTMGPGGDFDTARPARIDAMSAILLFAPDNPVEVPIDMYSVDEWQLKVPVKATTGTFPQICYDTGDYPLRSLNFWPIPNTTLNLVRIYSWAALAEPAALNTPIAFPPGYQRALRFNLAVDLAAEFGVANLPPVVAQVAIESKAVIKTMNVPDLGMQSDLMAAPAGYNYKADLFGIGL
jgi:hypothetical protein